MSDDHRNWERGKDAIVYKNKQKTELLKKKKDKISEEDLVPCGINEGDDPYLIEPVPQ